MQWPFLFGFARNTFGRLCFYYGRTEKRIADGLEAASKAEKDLESAQAKSEEQLKAAKVDAAALLIRQISELHKLWKRLKNKLVRKASAL